MVAPVSHGPHPLPPSMSPCLNTRFEINHDTSVVIKMIKQNLSYHSSFLLWTLGVAAKSKVYFQISVDSPHVRIISNISVIEDRVVSSFRLHSGPTSSL